ncbi:MAG: hypothetical protein LQ351_003364 [Letrouitia transgressa]|nr:MAG: hypothetical protein LQ351_003364 [Letrouitia transgressa]
MLLKVSFLSFITLISLVVASTIITDNTTTTILNPDTEASNIHVEIIILPGDLPIDIYNYLVLTASLVSKITLLEVHDPIVELELDLGLPIIISVLGARHVGYRRIIGRKQVLDGLVRTANQYTPARLQNAREFRADIYEDNEKIGTIFVTRRENTNAVVAAAKADPGPSVAMADPVATSRRRRRRHRRQSEIQQLTARELEMTNSTIQDNIPPTSTIPSSSSSTASLPIPADTAPGNFTVDGVTNAPLDRNGTVFSPPFGFFGAYAWHPPLLLLSDIFLMLINSAPDLYLRPLDLPLVRIVFASREIKVKGVFESPSVSGSNAPSGEDAASRSPLPPGTRNATFEALKRSASMAEDAEDAEPARAMQKQKRQEQALTLTARVALWCFEDLARREGRLRRGESVDGSWTYWGRELAVGTLEPYRPFIETGGNEGVQVA